MADCKSRIEACIDYLNSIRFPCEDWVEDKKYFDQLEQEYSEAPADEGARALWEALRKLICDKRTESLNRNKTAEELYAGWDD